MDSLYNLQKCDYSNININDLEDQNIKDISSENCMCPIIDDQKCKYTSGCLNVLSGIECPRSCGLKCQNQKIRNSEYIKYLRVYDTKLIGLGVLTDRKIPAFSYILEYTGEVLTTENYKLRCITEDYKNSKHSYGLEINKKYLVDARNVGNLARFINSSCDPNCYVDKIYVDALPRMVIKARTDIAAGQPLTFNYKFKNFGKEDWLCKCDARNCVSKQVISRSDESTFDGKCEFCVRVFKYPSDLSRHTATHEMQQPEVCVICKKALKSKDALRKHKIKVHNIKWKHDDTQLVHHTCPICSIVLRYPSQMTKHMESHGNDRAYSCAICQREFKSKRNLKEHQTNQHLE